MRQKPVSAGNKPRKIGRDVVVYDPAAAIIDASILKALEEEFGIQLSEAEKAHIVKCTNLYLASRASVEQGFTSKELIQAREDIRRCVAGIDELLRANRGWTLDSSDSAHRRIRAMSQVLRLMEDGGLPRSECVGMLESLRSWFAGPLAWVVQEIGALEETAERIDPEKAGLIAFLTEFLSECSRRERSETRYQEAEFERWGMPVGQTVDRFRQLVATILDREVTRDQMIAAFRLARSRLETRSAESEQLGCLKVERGDATTSDAELPGRWDPTVEPFVRGAVPPGHETTE